MKFLGFLVLTGSILLAACSPAAEPKPDSSNLAPVTPAVPDNLTPLETIKALSAASKSGDTAGIKRRLNRGSLALLEKSQGATPLASMSDARNEKIEGDKAFVDVQDAITKSYVTIPLVKEDGQWKVAMDIYTETLRQKLTEDMKAPPKNPAGKK